MRYLIRVALSLFAPLLLSFGSEAKDYKLLVALNLNDCISCYNHDLNKLGELQDDVDIVLVLGEAFEPRADKVIEKYNLNGITDNIIWSDSLLSRLTGDGPSAIVFASKYHTRHYWFMLKSLPESLTDYIHRAARPFDSVLLDYPGIATGSRKFYVHEGRVYFINSILDEINGYDLLTGKRVMHFVITDSLLDATFPFSGLPARMRAVHHDILQKAHMAPYEIEGLAFNKDTVYARFMNGYFTVRDDSASERDNVSMLKIVKNKVWEIGRYPFCFPNVFDDDKIYCASNRNFCYLNGAIYNFIYTGFDKLPNRDVLGRFELNNDDRYEMTAVHSLKSPEIYATTIDCGLPMFNGGYFAFPLIDTLYSIADSLKAIPLDFLSPESKMRDATERCMDGIIMTSFKVTEPCVWLAIYNIKTQESMVLKHDRRTGGNQYSKVVLPNSRRMHIDFDPINPDYILYMTQTGRLYRRKMF